jgi:hypothetical protein
MKTYLAGIQNSTQTTYSPSTTKSTILGRAFQKTINSQQVIGPGLTDFIDVQTLAGFAPGLCYLIPGQNLLLVTSSTLTAGAQTVGLWNFNVNTGANSYVGKIILNVPNSPAVAPTAYTGISAYSNGTTIQIFLAPRYAALSECGLLYTNVSISNFTPAGTTIYPASGTNQNNVLYLLQGNDYYGITNAANTGLTTIGGVDVGFYSSSSSINTKVYATNGSSTALMSVVSWDFATAPAVASTVTNSVSTNATGYTNTSPTCYFTMGATNPGYNTSVTPAANIFEAIVMLNGTGAAPTVGTITPWTPGSAQGATNAAAIRDLQQQFTLTLSAPVTVAAATTVAINGITWNIVTTQTSTSSLIVSSPIPTAWNGVTQPIPGSYTTSGSVAITVTAVTPGNWYFNIATTAAPTTALTTVPAASNFTIMRAFGTSNNNFYGRTPTTGFTVPPAGTLLTTFNTLSYSKPVSVPASVALNGQDCLTISAASNLTMGKISDLFFPITITTTAGSTAFTYTGTLPNLGYQYLLTGAAMNSVLPAGTLITTSSLTTSSGILSTAALASGTNTFIAGANTWNTIQSVGAAGTTTGDIVAPTVIYGRYDAYNMSNSIDKIVYITSAATTPYAIVMKPFQAINLPLTAALSGVSPYYYEANNPITTQLGLAGITQIDARAGWIFALNTAAGQRGITYLDAYSDALFGNSAIISPILNVPAGSIFKEVDSLEQLFDYTNSLNFWIRSATTSGDAIFSTASLPVGSPATSGVISNGWTSIKTAQDLSSIAIGPYFQLCATFQIITLNANTPAQVYDLKYTVTRYDEISDNWEGSVDNTTQNGASPSYTAFRLQTAYSGSVPTLYFRAYDDNGNLVASANTASNSTLFNYSTNNGTSWNALGTIPNTPLTTEIRYVWPSPPGVRVTCSIRES